MPGMAQSKTIRLGSHFFQKASCWIFNIETKIESIPQIVNLFLIHSEDTNWSFLWYLYFRRISLRCQQRNKKRRIQPMTDTLKSGQSKLEACHDCRLSSWVLLLLELSGKKIAQKERVKERSDLQMTLRSTLETINNSNPMVDWKE